jgi:tetratricopeptide (TPR) repeat protein
MQCNQVEATNAHCQNTLGVAYYRLGNFEKALGTLQHADQLIKPEFQCSHPADLAFLAMNQHRLGHRADAQAYLKQLRERMKDPRLASCAKRRRWWRKRIPWENREVSLSRSIFPEMLRTTSKDSRRASNATMSDPILEEIWRVRQELIKRHGGLDGYFAYVQKLDRARQRSVQESKGKKARKRKTNTSLS